MKYILFLCLIFPVVLQAQECKLISETDPYTKEKLLSTGFIFLSGGSVSIDANAKEIDVLFSIEGADKCYDNNSTAEVYFEGLTSKTLTRNAGTMNCEGLFHFVFRNTRSTPVTLLKRMMTMKMTKIIFTGNDKKKTKTTITVGEQEQEVLMKLATCLVNDAHDLIR